MKTEALCDVCHASPVVGFVGKYHGLNEVCEPCGTRMETCKHKEGDRNQKYDADGCGYYVWCCDECGWCVMDDMPFW